MAKSRSTLWRKLGIGFIFLSLIAATFWLYATHKPPVNSPIPKEATSIVCLDVTNLRNTLLKEYFTQDNLDATPIFDIREIGLKLPNYVLGFTMPSSSTVIYTSIDIENKALFYQWADSNFVVPTNFESYQLYENRNAIYLASPDHNKIIMAVGLDVDKHQVVQLANSIFVEKATLKKDHSLLEKIRQSKEIGFVWFKKGRRLAQESTLVMDFAKGIFSVKGALFLNDTYQFEEQNQMLFGLEQMDNQFFLSLGNSFFLKEITQKIDKNKFQKLANFSLDSLLKYSDNSLNFYLNGSEITRDTAITYEFDDDFNKVEKKQINESVHPLFDLILPQKQLGFYGYLQADSCIKTINGEAIFTPYPFSKVYVENKSNYIQFINSRLRQEIELIPKNHWLYAQLTANEIDSTLLNQVGELKPFIENNTIKLKGIQRGDSTKIDFSIQFN